jgi:hypothetical protein
MMFPKWMTSRPKRFPKQLLETQRDIVIGNYVGATYRQEEIVDSQVRSILREVRIKNYCRNLIWTAKWLWRCTKYLTATPHEKLLAWHSKMYYKWGTSQGGEDDSRVHQVFDVGSSEGGPVKPSDPN